MLFFEYFFFPSIELVISIVLIIYTAMVRRIQQFFEVLFENTALHFLESPLFASPAVKCGSKLLAAKLVIVYYEPKVKHLGKFHIKFRVW